MATYTDLSIVGLPGVPQTFLPKASASVHVDLANVRIGVSNPIYIGTASADVLQEGWMTIQAITWTDNDTDGNDIADGDDFTITDEAGNVIVHKQASAAGDGLDGLMFPYGHKINGLICTELDGGVALIYLKSYEG